MFINETKQRDTNQTKAPKPNKGIGILPSTYLLNYGEENEHQVLAVYEVCFFFTDYLFTAPLFDFVRIPH